MATKKALESIRLEYIDASLAHDRATIQSRHGMARKKRDAKLDEVFAEMDAVLEQFGMNAAHLLKEAQLRGAA